MSIEIEIDENELIEAGTELEDDANTDTETEQDEVDTTFEVNGKKYEIAFNIKRIALYERTVHKPIIASFAMNGGSFSVDELEYLIAFGTRPLGGAGYVNPKRGMAMAEKLIETNGYTAVYTIVTQALMRDCDFLFLAE